MNNFCEHLASGQRQTTTKGKLEALIQLPISNFQRHENSME